ncbi:MAG: efflux RND transporter permease subunit, partial [Rhodothermales bacterium]|nr:efflux RND transporter permease subunit [Rhodothermales bacterium]
MSITDTSIRRPVATAMFYLVVLTIGVVGFFSLPVDLLPPIETSRLTVYTTYPNVGPEEMEQIVTDLIENAVSGVPNVERITSRSSEGNSFVSLEFAKGTGLDEAANDIRSALDRVRDNLPPEAEAPGIWKFDPNNISIITLAVESSRNLEEATRLLEREVAQRFEQIQGVGTVEVRGGVYREIRVNLNRDRLKAADLTPSDVQQALARENARLPGGNVKEGVLDLYVRTLGEFTSVDQIRNTVVRYVDDRPVRVRDVAEVMDGYEDVRFLSEIDGVPVVRLQIQKQSGANTVTVADAILSEAQQINVDYPDLKMTVMSDQSQFIRQSIDSVKNSAFWGGLLAILILYLFLRNGSSTFIIALSIPISVVATFGLLYFTGMTLNQMTFGGLALGIGMMVDNGIVVLENIVRHREEKGMSLIESASVGTREVVGAIIASTLTTCVIFVPLLFMETITGELFQALAIVVVFSLACSLIAAVTLVPVLSSRFLSVRAGHREAPSAGSVVSVGEGIDGTSALIDDEIIGNTSNQSAVSDKTIGIDADQSEKPRKRSRFQLFIARLEERYSNLLPLFVKRRSVVFGVTVVAVVTAVFFWGTIPVELAPATDADEIQISMDMAEGTNIAVVKS